MLIFQVARMGRVISSWEEVFSSGVDEVAVNCEFCDRTNVRATNSFTFDVLSDYLIIYFNTFSSAGKLVHQRYALPSHFSIGHDTFDVEGVVVHTGESIKRGHYYSKIKINDTWLILNDHNPVEKVVGEVLHIAPFTETPSIVLAKKRPSGTPAPRKQSTKTRRKLKIKSEN